MGIDPKALDQSRIPRHVAVIMDGNGRWAKKRALNRLRGHKAGIEAVRETIRCANDCGVDYLTIYVRNYLEKAISNQASPKPCWRKWTVCMKSMCAFAP